MIPKIKQLIHFISSLFGLDKTIIITLLILCIGNLFIQYSATDKDISKLINDGAYLVLSFVVLFIVANLNITHLKAIATPLYIFSILLLLGVIFLV